MSRPAVVLGLQPAGLAVARSLGRAGIQVTGIALERADFGLASRYVRRRNLVLGEDRDERVLAALREAARGGPLVVIPERDEHVDLVLRRLAEVDELGAVPLPGDRAAVDALRGKDSLTDVAAAAGLATPHTVTVATEDELRACPLERPFLLKPLESERYAAAFSHKVVVVDDPEAALPAWRRARDAGFALVAQELVPDSTDRILSLFAYIGRDGRRLAAVVGRKVRQGPPGFGASTIFAVEPAAEIEEAGLALLASVGYTGFAHVELVRHPRDGGLRLLEVNTRLPVWAGVAIGPRYDMARVAHADLSGEAVDPLPTFTEPVSWVYLGKDVVTLARSRRVGPRAALAPYRGEHANAVLARDDPGPALAQARWLVARAVEKARA